MSDFKNSLHSGGNSICSIVDPAQFEGMLKTGLTGLGYPEFLVGNGGVVV